MQKICIIGDGMSGLIAAAILGQENIKIDLYSSKEKKIKSKKDNRTTAISENNYKYLLNKFNLQSSKFFWPSKEVNLFYENDNQIKNFLNLKEQNENLMYIFKNNQFIRIINRVILKNKKIKIVKKKKSIVSRSKLHHLLSDIKKILNSFEIVLFHCLLDDILFLVCNILHQLLGQAVPCFSILVDVCDTIEEAS